VLTTPAAPIPARHPFLQEGNMDCLLFFLFREQALDVHGIGGYNARAMSTWQDWISRPQTVWLRKAMFQIHLWSGIGVGLYVLLISVTGSIAVYSNELYRAATRPPVIVTPTGPLLSEEELNAAVRRAYPEFSITSSSTGSIPNQATTFALDGPGAPASTVQSLHGRRSRRFGAAGIVLVTNLLSLHDDLFAGETAVSQRRGRHPCDRPCAYGIVVWWPGIQSWRRSLTMRRTSAGGVSPGICTA
jgi:hypothetical protein